jgi:hypothetical protein
MPECSRERYRIGGQPIHRAAADADLDSLRSHTLQVVGTVKRGKPETAARANALLEPSQEWESTKPAKEKTETAQPIVGDVMPAETSSTGNGNP